MQSFDDLIGWWVAADRPAFKIAFPSEAPQRAAAGQ